MFVCRRCLRNAFLFVYMLPGLVLICSQRVGCIICPPREMWTNWSTNPTQRGEGWEEKMLNPWNKSRKMSLCECLLKPPFIYRIPWWRQTDTLIQPMGRGWHSCLTFSPPSTPSVSPFLFPSNPASVTAWNTDSDQAQKLTHVCVCVSQGMNIGFHSILIHLRLIKILQCLQKEFRKRNHYQHFFWYLR